MNKIKKEINVKCLIRNYVDFLFNKYTIILFQKKVCASIYTLFSSQVYVT